MNNQKLIMENWRRFRKQPQKSSDCGFMFLLEGPEVRRVSFEKRVKMLNEGKNRDVFIEEWAKSANYMMDLMESGKLNEGMYEKFHVWLWGQIQKLISVGAAAVPAIGDAINRARQFGKDNPKTAMMMKVALLGTLVALFPDAAMASGDNDITNVVDLILQNQDVLENDELISTLKSMKSFAGEGNPITQEVVDGYDRSLDGQLVRDIKGALEQVKAELANVPEPEQSWADRLKGQLDAAGSKIQSAVGGGEAEIVPDVSGPEMPEGWSIEGSVATGPGGETYDLQTQRGLRQYQQAAINIDPAEKEKFMKGMQAITKDKPR